MIKCEALSIGYDSGILATIDYSFKNGITLVLGSNGAGKSTLVKTIAGFIAAKDGELFISGESYKSISDKRRIALMSYLPSKGNRVGFMKAEEYLELGVTQTDITLQSILIDFGLENLVGTYISNLSDGQFQRLRVAKSFYLNKGIVLLDEPLIFLDPYQKGQLVKAIEYYSGNRVVLIVSHDFSPFQLKTPYLFIDQTPEYGLLENFNPSRYSR